MTKNVSATSYGITATGTGGTYNSWEPSGTGGDWQLAAGHYEPATTTAELIHPRPDSETPVWAKHRRHYPGIPYAIPIGISFGSWPYYFEVISLPSGATIGSQLTASGDKLIVGDDYGVVEWDNPTVGNHSCHIRVHFQDGASAIDVQWNLEVTTTGTIFVDATAADDTGTGAIGDPFKTLEGWFKSDNTDRTFTQYQVCYRAGTYDVYTSDPATTGNMQFNWLNKPLVHYAYGNEAAVWNFDTGTLVMGNVADTSGGEYNFHDWFLGGISCTGGMQTDSARRYFLGKNASTTFPYNPAGTGAGCRNTWFRSPQIDWTYAGDAGNNGGIVFGTNTLDVTRTRSHWFITQCDISNITTIGASATNFNGWYVGNMSKFLMESLTVTNTNFGRGVMTGKSSEYKSCYRNIDQSAAPDQRFIPDNAGSYAPLIGGGNEVSYCKINYQASGAGLTALVSGHSSNLYAAENPYHLPNYHFRNSVSKAPSTSGEVFRAFYGWPVEVSNDVWCSEGDGIYNDAPSNTQGDGGWELYDVASNPFDADMNLLDRVTHLGTKGAEVAQ